MADNENQLICFVCELPEDTPSRVIECVNCCRSVHFRCKKLFGNAVAKVKKKPYFCSVECAETHSRTNKSQAGSGNEDILKELQQLNRSVKESKEESAHIRIAFEKIRMEISALVTTSKHIEESQEFLANRFDVMQADLKTFGVELGKLNADNVCLHKEIDGCKENVQRLEMELDKMQRATLSKNAVIIGLPTAENENVKQLIDKVGSAIDFPNTADAIVNARRLGLKNDVNRYPPVLVTFINESWKEKFFDCKRSHGPLLVSAVFDGFAEGTKTIIVRDELTTLGRELLREAKEFQTLFDIKYVWPGRNGKILMRKQDGAKVEEIRSKQQLRTMEKTLRRRTLNSADQNSSSPILEPSPKRKQSSRV